MVKRKVMVIFLILALIFSASSVAFAKVSIPEPGIMPQYLATLSIMTAFAIDSNGNSVGLIDLQTKASYSRVDSVKATVRLVDYETNKTIKTWSNVTMDGPTLMRVFTFEEKYKIPESGSYYIKGTLKLYDGTTLVETVTCESQVDSF